METIVRVGSSQFNELPPVAIPIQTAVQFSFLQGAVYEHEDGCLVEAQETHIDKMNANCFVLDPVTLERGDLISVWDSQLLRLIGVRRTS